MIYDIIQVFNALNNHMSGFVVNASNIHSYVQACLVTMLHGSDWSLRIGLILVHARRDPNAMVATRTSKDIPSISRKRKFSNNRKNAKIEISSSNIHCMLWCSFCIVKDTPLVTIYTWNCLCVCIAMRPYIISGYPDTRQTQSCPLWCWFHMMLRVGLYWILSSLLGHDFRAESPSETNVLAAKPYHNLDEFSASDAISEAKVWRDNRILK